MTAHVPRPFCADGQHNPIHRGVLGGYFCGYCNAIDSDGKGDWEPHPDMRLIDGLEVNDAS
jgi:hypothetical protein